MRRDEFNVLVTKMFNSGLNEDQILDVFIQAFETGRCDIDDLELMFDWMRYELMDDFYKDHGLPVPKKDA